MDGFSLVGLIAYGIIGLYFFCQTHLFIISIAQFSLLINSLKKPKYKQTKLVALAELPMVTVQLPVYNEKYVVAELIDSILQFNYPAHLLDIQVLDDSTDDTTEIIQQKIVSLLGKTNVSISHIQRTKREGFKAGALKNGLSKAKGEFIAIFDADFRPHPNFLQATIPHFWVENVGMVQTRCGYNNRVQTLITRTLAFGMDIYYTIEQGGRYNADVFFIFNGTGGIWRKKCIEIAGNWQGDTLAEDLDLSYRAQMAGWKFIYIEDFLTNGELPPQISAVRIQQYRWIKGSVECGKKLIPLMLKYPTSFVKKFHSLNHLTNSFAFLSIFICSILSIPMMVIKHYQRIEFAPSAIFVFSSLVVLIQVFVSIKKTSFNYKGANILMESFIYLPLSLVIFMGLYIENAKAVMHGLMGKKTEFVRTPKMGDTVQINEYFKGGKFSLGNVFELAMILYFTFGVALSFVYHDVDFLVFHLCLIVGYFLILYHSVKERSAK